MPHRVLCHGEALIDFVSVEKGCKLRHAGGFKRAPGGAPANVAVGLARQGTPSAFLGMAGEDEFGYCLRETLQQNGVDVSTLLHTSKAKTTLAFVSVQEDGDRSFAFYRQPGADIMLTEHDVKPEMFDGFKVFHFGSLSMSAEPCRQATLKALQLADEREMLVSYDPNLRLPLWKTPAEAKEWMLRGLSYADVVKISEEEGEFLFGPGAPRVWAEKIAEACGASAILVTSGANGALAHVNGAFLEARGFEIEVADTTGAGDAFVAGWWHSLGQKNASGLAGLDANTIRDALEYACAAGALTCTKSGAIPALPTADEVAQFLRDRAD